MNYDTITTNNLPFEEIGRLLFDATKVIAPTFAYVGLQAGLSEAMVTKRSFDSKFNAMRNIQNFKAFTSAEARQTLNFNHLTATADGRARFVAYGFDNINDTDDTSRNTSITVWKKLYALAANGGTELKFINPANGIE